MSIKDGQNINKAKNKKRNVKADAAEDTVPQKKSKLGEKTPFKGNKTSNKEHQLTKRVAEKSEKKLDEAQGTGTDDPSSAKRAKTEVEKKAERSKQKETKANRQRREKTEEVYTLGVEAKRLWEKVRREDCPVKEKDELLHKLHDKIKGNVKKLIFAHDTVRVIECLMALGDATIREALFRELQKEIIPMIKSKYASFFVTKIIKYGSKAQKEEVFKTFEGKVAELMKHKIANNVVEAFYNDVAGAKQRNRMLQEFCGPEFRHFKEEDIRTIEALIEKFPEKKKDILHNLGENVATLINKGCYNHSFVHTVIYNYMVCCSPKSRTELIEQLRDVVVHVLHSGDGCRLSQMALWHGTPKDRKAIIKSFKTMVAKICHEATGHRVLYALFDSVDDTKLVGKAILGEIIDNLGEVASSVHGRKVLMYLLSPRNTKYFSPDEQQIVRLGDGNEHSKKDATTRSNELRAVVAAPIVKYVVDNMSSLLAENNTIIFMICVLNALPYDTALPALSALAEEAAKPFADQEDEQASVVASPAGHMMMKKVIEADKDREEGKRFSELVLAAMDEDSVESWIRCNRGNFLFVKMMDVGSEELAERVKNKVMTLKKTFAMQKTKGAILLKEKFGTE